MTVGAFMLETLRERATGTLKGEDGGIPPTRPGEVADVLGARLAEVVEQIEWRQAEALARLELRRSDELAAALAAERTEKAELTQVRKPVLVRLIEALRRRKA